MYLDIWTDSIQTAYKQCIVNVQTVSGSAWTNSVQIVDIYICAQTVHKMRYWPDGQYIHNVQFTDTVPTVFRHSTDSAQTKDSVKHRILKKCSKTD